MDTTSPSPASNRPKFVRWALVLAIAVILNIFFTVLVALALPAPDYNTYCPANQLEIAPADAKTCDANGGMWMDTTGDSAAPPAPVYNGPNQPASASGYCDMTAKCQPVYQSASDQHALYAFTLMIGLGILALVIGLLVPGSAVVSSGLSYGGVIAFIIGSASYWGTAGNWIRLAIAAVGLIALIYIGWKRFAD